jgi:hypothetical protein
VEVLPPDRTLHTNSDASAGGLDDFYFDGHFVKLLQKPQILAETVYFLSFCLI